MASSAKSCNTSKDRIVAEILIGEDDADVRKWLAIALETEGFAVRTAADGEATLEAATATRPDLLVLDVMMPKMSGLEVCKAIRTFDRTLPILMLTARNKDEDVIAGLGAGADDYVTKPFALKVLLARIAALFRRTDAAKCRCDVNAGGFRLDARKMALAFADGREVLLTAREYELLKLLADHRGEVLRRDDLLNRIWGLTFYGNTRTLDQHIALLRRKLGACAESIETVRNVGYRLIARPIP